MAMASDQRFWLPPRTRWRARPGSVDAESCREPARQPATLGAAVAAAAPDAAVGRCEVGPGRGAGFLDRPVSPDRFPNPPCDFHRNGLSV